MIWACAAWGVAAVVTYYILKDGRLSAWANANVPYLENDKVAMAAVGGAAFIIVLIIISIVSVKISDFVVDSRAGAFDRTLGLFYGFARGLVLVAVAYMFYVMWLVPESRHEPWIKNAVTLPLIKFSRDGLFNLLPLQVQETLRQSTTEDSAADTPGDKTEQPEGGYKNNESQGLENLIQGTGGDTQQPASGQGTSP